MKRNIIVISLMAAGLFTFGNVYADADTTCKTFSPKDSCVEDINISNDKASIKITLKDDISTTSQIVIDGKYYSDADSSFDVTDVTIDLNGHTLSYSGELDENNHSFIRVEKGNLTITGSGKVSTSDGFAITTADSAKKSISIGKDVTIETTETDEDINTAINAGIATHATIDVYGTVISKYGIGIAVNGQQQTISGCATIRVHDGATVEASKSFALFLAGYANTTIDAATIKGETGIGIKSGVLTLNNTTVNATGEAEKIEITPGAMVDTGAAIAVENATGYAADGDKQTVEININGGTYTSKNNSAFMEYGEIDDENGTALDELSIKDATFESKASYVDVIDLPEESNLENFISGGKFLGRLGADFQNYLVEGLEVRDDGSIVNPLEPANPSDPTNPEQTGSQAGSDNGTGDNTIDDSPKTYDGIMSYVTMALTSVGAVALSLKKVLSR